MPDQSPPPNGQAPDDGSVPAVDNGPVLLSVRQDATGFEFVFAENRNEVEAKAGCVRVEMVRVPRSYMSVEEMNALVQIHATILSRALGKMQSNIIIAHPGEMPS